MASQTISKIYDLVAEDFSRVNALILARLCSTVPVISRIGEHLIGAGGKRLRPLIVLLGARALGHEGKHSITLAAVIELLHTATLLHDDVVDISTLRRGYPTAHTQWGNGPCILAGDFLYSRAFQMMVEIQSMPVMKILSDATCVISEGEVSQLVNARNSRVTESQYLQIISAKTAQLFQAASQSVATLSEASDYEAAFGQYGYHLGMAFQLVDDVMDFSGDLETMGKNLGDDLAEGKPTLPLIYVMNNGEAADKALVERVVEGQEKPDLARIQALVQRAGALDYALSMAEEQVRKARQALHALSASAYKEALLELADFALVRRH